MSLRAGAAVKQVCAKPRRKLSQVTIFGGEGRGGGVRTPGYGGSPHAYRRDKPLSYPLALWLGNIKDRAQKQPRPYINPDSSVW